MDAREYSPEKNKNKCGYIYIYIYIYINKNKVNTQGKDQLLLLDLSFTPLGDLQATGSSNLLQAHINKVDI